MSNRKQNADRYTALQRRFLWLRFGCLPFQRTKDRSSEVWESTDSKADDIPSIHSKAPFARIHPLFFVHIRAFFRCIRDCEIRDKSHRSPRAYRVGGGGDFWRADKEILSIPKI